MAFVIPDEFQFMALVAFSAGAPSNDIPPRSRFLFHQQQKDSEVSCTGCPLVLCVLPVLLLSFVLSSP